MNAKHSPTDSRSQIDIKSESLKPAGSTKVVFKRPFNVKSLSEDQRSVAREVLNRLLNTSPGMPQA